MEYYLLARGYYDGGRFLWKGLDSSYITAYNYSIHYTYNEEDDILAFGDIKTVRFSCHSE